MGSGIRVVGGSPAADEAVATTAADHLGAAEGDGRRHGAAWHREDRRGTEGHRAEERAPLGDGDGSPGRRRRAGFVVACMLAVLGVLGVVGTIVFGTAWEGLHATQAGEAQASAKAKTFLMDLTNFDAKTVDADFAAITSMATGPFAGQADKFFNSSIRQELQRALASSRGQVRDLNVQSYGQTRASVYGVVTELYSNDKVISPQTDVLRIVLTMQHAGGAWKVADVTVLTGPSPGTTPTTPGSSSGTTPGTGTSPTGG